MIRESVLHTARYATIVVAKTTLNQNVDPVVVRDLTQIGLERSKESSLVKCGKCGHKKVDCIEYSQESDESDSSDSNSKEIQDLTEQVQSLFYH